MFYATLTEPYTFPASLAAAYTKGKVYKVLDANDWSGTYTIVNDHGDRVTIDWMRFADQGSALSVWQRRPA